MKHFELLEEPESIKWLTLITIIFCNVLWGHEYNKTFEYDFTKKLIKHLNAYDIEYVMLSFTLELKKTHQDQIW